MQGHHLLHELIHQLPGKFVTEVRIVDAGCEHDLTATVGDDEKLAANSRYLSGLASISLH